MGSFLVGLQVALSMLLSLVILVQNRGTGLGSLAGGGGGSFQAERRGAEKLLHRLTVVLGFAFCLNVLLIHIFSDL
ncbi:preprotein translocase subunit SecG [Candidatus Peregrinibacteria bacterium]|nr:MAG: preprotein translocase subunit SecG [Candidatus Peregrinibacteria bacterium]